MQGSQISPKGSQGTGSVVPNWNDMDAILKQGFTKVIDQTVGLSKLDPFWNSSITFCMDALINAVKMAHDAKILGEDPAAYLQKMQDQLTIRTVSK